MPLVCRAAATAWLESSALKTEQVQHVGINAQDASTHLYMSKRSGTLRRHKMGDSSAATGAGGALRRRDGQRQRGNVTHEGQRNMHVPGVGGSSLRPIAKWAPDAAAVPAPSSPALTHLGVCLDIMYCWGGAYRGSSRYWLGT